MNWTERGMAAITIFILILSMLLIIPQVQYTIDHPPPVTEITLIESLFRVVLVGTILFFMAFVLYYLQSHSHPAA
jgi:hypothetical protein